MKLQNQFKIQTKLLQVFPRAAIKMKKKSRKYHEIQKILQKKQK